MAQGEGGGRPKIPFDIEQFEEMCKIQCTETEIAAVLKMDIDTLNRRCWEHYGKCFADTYAEKREGGKRSLRRAQWETAVDKANPIMQIFLGKNMLGQADKTDIKVTGLDIKVNLPDSVDTD